MPKKTNKVTRTTAGLADVLFDELDALIDGSSNPQMAKAKVAIVNSVISKARLEMDHARFVADIRVNKSISSTSKLKAIELGE